MVDFCLKGNDAIEQLSNSDVLGSIFLIQNSDRNSGLGYVLVNASQGGVLEQENGDLLGFFVDSKGESEDSSVEDNSIEAGFEVVEDLLRVGNDVGELAMFLEIGPIDGEEVQFFGGRVYRLNFEDLRVIELEEDLKVFLLTFEAEWG